MTCSLRARNCSVKTCWSWRRSSWTGADQSKSVQGNALLEAGLQQVAFEGLLVAPLDLVGQQQGQECGVVELLGACQRQPLGQGGHELAQLQALEQTHQIGIDAHGCGLVRA